MNTVPTDLYSAKSSQQLDQIAIEEFGIDGYQLMSRAGACVADLLQQHYSLAKRILICCGAGNNAGDGYVVARLAHQNGFDVDVVSMIDPDQLSGDAQKAYKDWQSLGMQLTKFDAEKLQKMDVVIDALLGTGLQRPVEGEWLEIIEAINASGVPVIAIDIPSGLSADTGSVMGAAVKADLTISFIAMKKGLFTHQAADYCGQLFFDDLGVPEKIYSRVPADAHRLHWPELSRLLKPRKRNSHKGDHGHVLVVGGDYGMPGAVIMAAQAALRSGAGLVTVATRADHTNAVVTSRPEIMVCAADDGIPQVQLEKASCIIVGPGLGKQNWGQHVLEQVLGSTCPKVVDADALNLLGGQKRDDWVLTPHPGEAARLLDGDSQSIQQSRFSAVDLLQDTFGGVVVLKGAGSLIKAGDSPVHVCPYGNPGMAVAGMGDVLSGVIAGLIAQGYDLETATLLGVSIHSKAGDLAAERGQRGLLASDLFAEIRNLVNPEPKTREH